MSLLNTQATEWKEDHRGRIERQGCCHWVQGRDGTEETGLDTAGKRDVSGISRQSASWDSLGFEFICVTERGKTSTMPGFVVVVCLFLFLRN